MKLISKLLKNKRFYIISCLFGFALVVNDLPARAGLKDQYDALKSCSRYTANFRNFAESESKDSMMIWDRYNYYCLIDGVVYRAYKDKDSTEVCRIGVTETVPMFDGHAFGQQECSLNKYGYLYLYLKSKDIYLDDKIRKSLLGKKITSEDYRKDATELLRLKDKSRKQEAIFLLNRAILMNPKNVYAHYSLIRAKLYTGDYQGVLSDSSRAMDIFPNDPNFYDLRAGAKYNLKDYRGIISDLNMALKKNPNNDTVFVHLGGTNLSRTDNNAYIYHKIGFAKQFLNDINGACSYWKKASKLGYKPAVNQVRDECQ